MRIHPIACLTLCLFSGCALPTSPLQSRALSPTVTPMQVATLGLGGVTGALIGEKLAGDTGALVGSATGLAAAALLHNAGASASDRRLAEIIEQARREERLRIMQEYWRDRTKADKSPKTGPSLRAPAPLHYPAGTYSGVNFAPRVAADAALSEPIR